MLLVKKLQYHPIYVCSYSELNIVLYISIKGEKITSVVKKKFTNPDDTMRSEKAEVQICNVGDVAAAKLTLQPG